MDVSNAMVQVDTGSVTTGQLTTGFIQTWPWDGNGTAIYPYPHVYVTPPPYYCSGNVHVFGCDHAEKCRCGQSKRKVEPPRCPHCGKAHQ